MAIRFQCPNGHTILAPAELSGRRGTCTDCGAIVEVPDLAPKLEETAAGATEKVVAPASPAKGGEEHATGSAQRAVAKPVAKPVARPVAKPTAAPPPPGGGAQSGQWYLRAPTGEQFGPAPDDQFRQWISDGRVGRESFLWREGWPDWRPAHEVADQLPAPLAPLAASPRPAGSSATARYTRRRKREAVSRLFWALALLVLTLALAGVLVFVMSRDAGSAGDRVSAIDAPLADLPFTEHQGA